MKTADGWRQDGRTTALQPWGTTPSQLFCQDLAFLWFIRWKGATNLVARFALVDVTDGSTYDMSQDYFRFTQATGVEPTNNHSEQQIRHVVIDRRITQGTRSKAGQRYNERMWTAIATCKKQNRNFFDFLLESIKAKLEGNKAPSFFA